MVVQTELTGRRFCLTCTCKHNEGNGNENKWKVTSGLILKEVTWLTRSVFWKFGLMYGQQNFPESFYKTVPTITRYFCWSLYLWPFYNTQGRSIIISQLVLIDRLHTWALSSRWSWAKNSGPIRRWATCHVAVWFKTSCGGQEKTYRILRVPQLLVRDFLLNKPGALFCSQMTVNLLTISLSFPWESR